MLVIDKSNDDIIAKIDDKIKICKNKLEILQNSDYEVTSPQSFENLEKKTQIHSRELGDLITAKKLQENINKDINLKESLNLARTISKKTKNEGKRKVSIKFSGGTVITLLITYYRIKSRSKKNKKGFYPSLCLMGVYDRCSPLLASIISQSIIALSSYEEARSFLSVFGCSLNVKTIERIAKQFAKRARSNIDGMNLSPEDNVKGKRIIVSVDGGRIRTRKKKRGPKTKKNRNRYSTDWKEPKLLIIYAVDDAGKKDKCFMPFLDGTMKGADVIFGLITYYLNKLKVELADKILFIADGAIWIWNRIDELRKKLGLKIEQFYELLDFYHATEHLSDIAKSIKNWSESERDKWVKKQKSRLLNGKIDLVIDAINVLCKGGRNKTIKTERDYFVRNKKRLDFKFIKGLNLPIGSGAVESAIRRVINLRFKGPGIFWKEESIEELIMLRSYFKSGRWNLLKNMAFSINSDTDF